MIGIRPLGVAEANTMFLPVQDRRFQPALDELYARGGLPEMRINTTSLDPVFPVPNPLLPDSMRVPKIGTLIWPHIGAQNYSVGAFLIDYYTLKEWNEAAGSQREWAWLDFYDTEEGPPTEVSRKFKVRILGAYPVSRTVAGYENPPTDEPEEDDMFVLIISDFRYDLVHTNWAGGQLSLVTDWASVFVSGFHSLAESVDAVPAEYGTPSDRWRYLFGDGTYSATLWNALSIAQFTDAACEMVGMRFVLDFDGTRKIIRPTAANRALLTDWHTARFEAGEVVAGGINDRTWRLGGIVPALDIFGHRPDMGERVQAHAPYIEWSARNAANFGGVLADNPYNGANTSLITGFRSRMSLMVDFDVRDRFMANDFTTIEDISNRRADDFWLWQIPSVDAVYTGFVQPPACGYIGVCEFVHTANKGISRIVSVPINYPGSLRADESWSLNVLPRSTTVRVITTAHHTNPLSEIVAGAVIDDVTLVTGDRVLMAGQASGIGNGIVVVKSGGHQPAPDFQTEDQKIGALVTVQEGTANGDTVWLCTTNRPITTSLSFLKIGGISASQPNDFTAEQTFTAGGPSNTPITIQGASGQTANLFEVRAFGGSLVLGIVPGSCKFVSDTTFEFDENVAITGDLAATGALSAATLSGNGAALTALNASNISSGTVAIARLPVDTDGTLAANSDALIASQKAVKTYVDALVTGVNWKASVRAATTAAGTLASDFENGDTIDGVVLATGDRILIQDQAAATENGIYVVAASGAPTRSADANTGDELLAAAVFVREGTTNGDRAFVCTNNSITIGSTSIAFVEFGSSVGALLAANNLSDLANAATARINLGVEIGADVQAWSADLDSIAAITGNNRIPYRVSDGVWDFVTISAGLGFTTGSLAVIPNGISDSMLRDSAALSVIGRGSNSTGDPADIAAGTDGHVLRRSGTTLAFGTIATAGIADDAVTYAKLQDISATQRVLGRNTAGAGNTEEVTLTQLLDWVGSAANGDILIRTGGSWTRLAKATDGQRLTLVSGVPAWFTAKGEIYGSSTVTTGQTTTSATPVDLATTQHVTFTVPLGDSGDVIVFVSATCTNGTTNAIDVLTIDVDGTDTTAAQVTVQIATAPFSASAALKFAGLAPGSHTIKLQFSTNAGTATFSNRAITVFRA